MIVLITILILSKDEENEPRQERQFIPGAPPMEPRRVAFLRFVRGLIYFDRTQIARMSAD
ncbi:Uncharacterised protein [uncultured archaeon]|nr:Uncharacterised protein [uncultured archaeon]